MSTLRQHWFAIALTTVSVVLIIFGAVRITKVSEWMPRSIVYAPNTDKKINPADDPSQSRLVELGVNRQLRVDVGPPPASLAVWIIEPPTNSSTRGTVLVLHGVQDKKTSMLDIGRRLATAGYRAVLVDGRGHGRSSGQWLTYGVLESRDLSQLLDALATQDLLAGKVGVYGVSYGAAAGIMLAGRDARVAAAVAVAPFASMREEVRDYVRNDVWSWFISDRTVEQAIARAGELAQFDPNEASALQAISETKAQVLLIHGKNDTKVPCRHSEALHSAAPDHSRLVLVERATHDTLSITYRNAIWQNVVWRESLAWFEHWLANQN